MKIIPVDQLQKKTSTGLEIKVFEPGEQQHKTDTLGAHRDDHYIFFLLKSGSGALTVDLQDIVLSAGQLYYITPSQVHHRIKADDCAEGWFLAVDTSLIPPEFRNIFEHRRVLQIPYSLTDDELKQYSILLNLLEEEFRVRQKDTFYLPVIHNLLHTFLAMAASNYNVLQTAVNQHTRPAELTIQFKNLLTKSHKLRSPSAYASDLNVSLGYLNESIKKVTGSTVTYWIQQEVFNEAKRLLFHSDADVKQIAHELGYTDYSYFSRSFRKASGMSPLGFRIFSRK